MEVNIQRLRELRWQKVLSMRELEEMSGVSYNTIYLASRKRCYGSATQNDPQDSPSPWSEACGTSDRRAIDHG
jgi:hypothetical protein